MAITIWSRDAKDSPSIFSSLELDVGQYDFVFDSNILTRNTVLLVAQNQREPLQVGGKIITVTNTSDDTKRITISLDVKKGQLPIGSEAGVGKATVYAVLGAIGVLAVFYVVEIKKTGNLANVGKAIGDTLAEIILRPGIALIVIFGILALIWIKAK